MSSKTLFFIFSFSLVTFISMHFHIFTSFPVCHHHIFLCSPTNSFFVPNRRVKHARLWPPSYTTKTTYQHEKTRVGLKNNNFITYTPQCKLKKISSIFQWEPSSWSFPEQIKNIYKKPILFSPTIFQQGPWAGRYFLLFKKRIALISIGNNNKKKNGRKKGQRTDLVNAFNWTTHRNKMMTMTRDFYAVLLDSCTYFFVSCSSCCRRACLVSVALCSAESSQNCAWESGK